MTSSQNIAVNAWQQNIMATRFHPNFDKGGRNTNLSHHFQHHSHISQGFGANLVQFVIPNFATLPKHYKMRVKFAFLPILNTYRCVSFYCGSFAAF